MPIQRALEFFVQWHLTERCNLRCRHCYQSGPAGEEMDFDAVREGIAEIAETVDGWSDDYGLDLGLSFTVTGGEPFLRADLMDILGEIRRRGYEAYLLSNGVLIDGEKARRLAELGVKGVQVSIEGPEEVHESIRGKGSFAAALRGVESLLRAGLEVNLNVTLSEINAGHFREMIALASSLGVPRLGFSRLVPAGRGLGMIGRMLPPGEVRRIYGEIFSLDHGPVTIVTGDPVAARMSSPAGAEDAGDVPRGGCAAGFSGVTILPDGTLLPCRRLPVPIGNMRTDSFREVWASSPVLAKLRDRKSYRGKCGSCPRWGECRGCRAIAWAWTSSRGEADYLAEDPQCFIEG